MLIINDSKILWHSRTLIKNTVMFIENAKKWQLQFFLLISDFPLKAVLVIIGSKF